MGNKIGPVAHCNVFATSTQIYTGTTNGQLVYFDEEGDNHMGLVISGTTRLVSRTSGAYEFNLSAIFAHTTGTGIDYDIWFRKNGVNIPNSNRKAYIKDSNIPAVIPASGNLHLQENDYMEVIWYSSSTAGQLLGEVSQVSPTRPLTPAIMMSIQKISD